MSQQQDNQERGRKIISRTFLVRVVAVLLFVALGSFAVFQSVIGDRTNAQLAAAEGDLSGSEDPAGTTQGVNGQAVTQSPETGNGSGAGQPQPAPTVLPVAPSSSQLARFTPGEPADQTGPPVVPAQQEPAKTSTEIPAVESRFGTGKTGMPEPRVTDVQPGSANPAGPESRTGNGLPLLDKPADSPGKIPAPTIPARPVPNPLVPNPMVPSPTSSPVDPQNPTANLARPAPFALPTDNVGEKVRQNAEAAGEALKGSSDNLLQQADSIVGKFNPTESAAANPADSRPPAFNPIQSNSPFANASQEIPAKPPVQPRTIPQQDPATIRAIPGTQLAPFSSPQDSSRPNQFPGQSNTNPVPGQPNANQFPGQPNANQLPDQSNANPIPETSSPNQPIRQPIGNGRTELPGTSGINTPITPAATTPMVPAGPRTGIGGNVPVPGAIPAGALATPGETNLEGVQTPALAIEKIAPREIQVNQPAKFRIVVRNVGRAPASDVRVHDRIPAGTELISSTPRPDNQGGGDALSWSLGELPPGQEKSIEMELRPTRPGEIGSVAQVTFASQASMRTRVTRPELSVEHSAPAQVMIGSAVTLQITVRNNGDGPATNVIIQEKVPEQLRYNAGVRDLEYEIGTLAPGQSRSIVLSLQAAEVGQFRNVVGIVGDGGLNASHETTIEVISPQLVTSADGPHRRFLKRDTSHALTVQNSGTAPATNLDLIAQLPRSLRFVSANNQGQYDPGSHAVYWSLAELRPGLSASVDVQTQPVETGNSQIEFTARADLNQKSVVQHDIAIEHLVDVHFEIDDVTDHIETGTSTEYRLRIINQGTKPASNVRLLAEFDSGIRPDSVSGGLRGQTQGQQIVFEPIPAINPGEEITATILATGVAPGEHRVAVNLQTDGREINITKEESTRVYSDR